MICLWGAFAPQLGKPKSSAMPSERRAVAVLQVRKERRWEFILAIFIALQDNRD
jgi:hypothetical protein